MKRLSLPFLFLFISLPSFATEAANPPTQVTRASYLAWLKSINSTVSPFADFVFDWYEAQLKTSIPAQVGTDPDKLYVTVEKALAETIKLEGDGDVEEGNTIGFDDYAIIDVPLSVALETKLYNMGKPVGQREGETCPNDTVFSSVHNKFSEKWGPTNYWSSQSSSGGGIVSSLHDDYSLLVRGDAQKGYVIFMSYFGPNADTPTQYHISIVMMKPTADGKTEYRQSVRQNGQSYKVFGLEFGRKNFGFNVSRDRQGVKALAATMTELKNTGKIKENCGSAIFNEWAR